MKKNIVGTFLFYTTFFWVIIISTIPGLLIACLPASLRYGNRLYAWASYWCYWLLIKATRIPIHCQGLEYLRKEPLVIIANHQSLLDIPLVGMLVGSHPHIWFFKQELGSIPVFGFFVKRMGILVNRKTLGLASQALNNGLSLLAQEEQPHVLIFPEGGRFIDGAVHPFFSGFAIIAQKTGRSVVPIMIKNINKAYPPGSFWIYHTEVTVLIGTPFTYQEAEGERAFVQRVHHWFKQQE